MGPSAQPDTPAGLKGPLWLPTFTPPQAAAHACQPNSIYMVIGPVWWMVRVMEVERGLNGQSSTPLGVNRVP